MFVLGISGAAWEGRKVPAFEDPSWSVSGGFSPLELHYWQFPLPLADTCL